MLSAFAVIFGGLAPFWILLLQIGFLVVLLVRRWQSLEKLVSNHSLIVYILVTTLIAVESSIVIYTQKPGPYPIVGRPAILGVLTYYSKLAIYSGVLFVAFFGIYVLVSTFIINKKCTFYSGKTLPASIRFTCKRFALSLMFPFVHVMGSVVLAIPLLPIILHLKPDVFGTLLGAFIAMYGYTGLVTLLISQLSVPFFIVPLMLFVQVRSIKQVCPDISGSTTVLGFYLPGALSFICYTASLLVLAR